MCQLSLQADLMRGGFIFFARFSRHLGSCRRVIYVDGVLCWGSIKSFCHRCHRKCSFVFQRGLCDEDLHKMLPSCWKTKQIQMERGNLLFAVMQITSAQRSTRLTSTSEHLGCHSVVKEAGNSRVRELVKKIEIHFHRKSLQRDLQQTMPTTHLMRSPRYMGNVEQFELFVADPKNAMHRVLVVLETRHRVLHLRISWKSSQLRRHSMDIGPSLNSKLCH